MCIDPPQQGLKIVRLLWELPGHLLPKELEIVGKPQRSTGKDDGRLDLRGEVEIVPAQPQLSQQLAVPWSCRARLAGVLQPTHWASGHGRFWGGQGVVQKRLPWARRLSP